MKRFLICVVTFLMILMVVLSGCSKSGTLNSTGESKKSTNKSIPEKLDNPDVNFLLNDITQWEEMQEAVKTFEEKYGGKVSYVLTDWAQLQTKLIAMVTSGDSPDHVYWNQTNMPLYVLKNILQPVDDYFDLKDPLWVYNVIKQFEFNGKHYGVTPIGGVPFFVYFNKTMFENNGLKTPLEYYKENNWNWNTLKELGMKLTADTDNDGAIDQWGFFVQNYAILARANGADFVNVEDDGSVTLNLDDPKVAEALQFFQDGMNQYKYIPLKIDAPAAFNLGKLAMASERWQFGNLTANLKDAKIAWDIVPLPTGPSGQKGVSPANAGFWGIPVEAKNPKGAATLTYINAQIGLTKEDSLSKQTFTEEQLNLINELSQNVSIAKYEGIGDIKKYINNDIKNQLSKGIPVATVLESLKPKMQAEIDLFMKLE